MTVYGILEAVEQTGPTVLDMEQNPELARMSLEVETLKQEARRSPANTRLTDLL